MGHLQSKRSRSSGWGSVMLGLRDNFDISQVVILKICTLNSILLMTYNQYWFYVPSPLKPLIPNHFSTRLNDLTEAVHTSFKPSLSTLQYMKGTNASRTVTTTAPDL
jgi:hypothetical protein